MGVIVNEERSGQGDGESSAVEPVRAGRSGFADKGLLIGPEGLRAGWSLLLFCLLIALLYGPAIELILLMERAVRANTFAAMGRPVVAVLIEDGVLLLMLVICSLVMSRIEGRPMAEYGIGRTRGAGRQFWAGLGWGIAMLSVLVLTLWATHRLRFDGRLLNGWVAVRYGLEWGLAFLLVGVCEEYFLRGYLQFTLVRNLTGLYDAVAGNRYAGVMGFWTAAAILSVVFEFGHRTNPGESPLGLLSVFAVGMVFCLSLWQTGSLWWAIGFHAAWDWGQSYLYGVADSGMVVQHHLLATRPMGPVLLSGGLTGPEGSVWVLPVLGLSCLVILATLKRRPAFAVAGAD